MTDALSPLIASRDGNVVHLQFNRPAVLNALDRATAQAFVHACRELHADHTVRAVVLSGAGRAFMAGGDLAELHGDPTGGAIGLLGPAHEAVVLLAELPAPVIAAVHGAVAGAGMSLALACDLVLAADDARFTLAYVKIGASCDVSASWSLPRLVGLRKAMEIALLSEPIDAAEALRLGLVNRVVPATELPAQAMALAQRLANGPTPAIGNLKRLLRTSFDHDLRGQLDAERSAFLACAASADFAEGVDAFLARRKPEFGRR
jgi:2-(1,2-epoxy-1,2-dihydrophenyl)acetyl-CoA isomerase